MLNTIRNFARGTRRIELFWRYGYNLHPSLNFHLKRAQFFSSAAARVLSDLDRDGIAITSVEEILEDRSIFNDLVADVDAMLEKRSEELADLKSRALSTDEIGEKTFNVELLGSTVEFDPDSVYARFALDDALLDIANAYFRMIVKLRYYNVWYTFATDTEPRESQLWHFDREDKYILKAFVYLRDVEEGGGPFTYVPGTHPKGSRRDKLPEYFLEKNVRRSTDEQMAVAVPKSHWVRGTGKKGTIIFADTRGMHKGGEARTSDRLMYTCMYTSPASESARLLKFPEAPVSLPAKKRSALEIDQAPLK